MNEMRFPVTGLWLFARALHAGPVVAESPAPPLMVAPHYSFDYGQLHFAMVNDSLDMSSPELAWLDADLTTSTRPVKIVTHHLPAWNPDGDVYGMGDNREAFLEVLRAHGVRYDFCGHDHGYRSGTTNGTTLVVSGGGGAPLYHTEKGGGFHHYVEITVAGTNVTFKPVRVTPVYQ